MHHSRRESLRENSELLKNIVINLHWRPRAFKAQSDVGGPVERTGNTTTERQRIGHWNGARTDIEKKTKNICLTSLII